MLSAKSFHLPKLRGNIPFRTDSFFGILGDPGADSGAEDEVKTGGKKFDEQKYERKIGVPGDKLFYGPVPNGRTNTRPRLGRKPFCIFLPNRRAAKAKDHLVYSNTKNNNKATLLAMFGWLENLTEAKGKVSRSKGNMLEIPFAVA